MILKVKTTITSSPWETKKVKGSKLTRKGEGINKLTKNTKTIKYEQKR